MNGNIMILFVQTRVLRMLYHIITDCKTLVKGNAAFLKESLAKNFKKIFGWI